MAKGYSMKSGGNRVAKKVRRINERQGAKVRRRGARLNRQNERIEEGNERRAAKAIAKGNVTTTSKTITKAGTKGSKGTPDTPATSKTVKVYTPETANTKDSRYGKTNPNPNPNSPLQKKIAQAQKDKVDIIKNKKGLPIRTGRTTSKVVTTPGKKGTPAVKGTPPSSRTITKTTPNSRVRSRKRPKPRAVKIAQAVNNRVVTTKVKQRGSRP
jgi:hypothetical protein